MSRILSPGLLASVYGAGPPTILNPTWINVEALLDFESLTDHSDNAFTVTANAGASLSTTLPKLGTKAGLMDGTDDYFLIDATGAAMDFLLADMCIECWFWVEENSAQDLASLRHAALFNTWGNATTVEGWTFDVLGNTGVTGTGLRFESVDSPGNTTGFVGTKSLALKRWHHAAFSVDAGTWRLFLNGEKMTSTNTTTGGTGGLSIDSKGHDVRVGRSNLNSFNHFLNGMVDGLRITKGEPLYTADFNPPNAPLPQS